MKQLKALYQTHEDWLMKRILELAKRQDYTRYTSTLLEAWRMSIAGLTEALATAIDSFGTTNIEFTPDDTYEDDPISAFAVREAELHRQRGISLGMFLGLLKYYRQSYLELLQRNNASPKKTKEYEQFVGRFFDRLEIALCVDWAKVGSDRQIKELQEKNRFTVNEKNRLLTLLESLPTPVFLLDSDLNIELMNLAAAELAGLANHPGQVHYTDKVQQLPKQVTNLKDTTPWLMDALTRTCALDAPPHACRFEAAIPDSPGTRHFSVAISPMSDISDKYSGFAMILDDITEKRQTEQDLVEKELLLRNMFLALGEALLILTPDRIVLQANPAAQKMFGLSEEDLIQKGTVRLHVSKKKHQDFSKMTREAFAKGEIARFEYPLRRSNGEIFPADFAVSLIKNDEGASLGIVNVIRDISIQKQAEESLRQSEEKFRRIFEGIGEGYVVTDLDGTILMINPATCRLLGYDKSEMIGADMGLLYNNAKERAKFKDILMTQGSVKNYHLTARHKDGSVIITEANARIVANDEGTPVALEGTFRDITARVEAERVLREQEEQYRAFFENNHAIMLLVAPETGRIEDANPAACAFYGYSQKEMQQMVISDINTLDELKIFQEMAKARDEKRSYFVFKHRLANGSIRDVEVYSGPIMVNGRQLLYSVIHDITQRVAMEREIKEMATTDALTGVNNRHQFFLLAGQELNRTKRYKQPLTVLMLDIDYFKTINDTYGHQTGDIVLKKLADTAIATLRETDIFGRIGGEEFAAVLPETDSKDAQQVAERLRQTLATLTITSGNDSVSFTVSIGISEVHKTDTDIETSLNRADEALYRAKRTGRNRTALY
ncbi:PAS domain S-box protein [uncultured Pseudodesulfovibrio sp.]|uniref:PAS domain S-box protein n=1 Tax=uncultured Pseudodesulfovibrio sp. TaxID=2035858 RepID=UPI0029C97516|nr:PAS domain S-box protein [uncultured Pseudodesulfovibrio sp.]